MAIAKGVSVGPYELLACIGAGGMGEVWRARDRRIGRDVAVKVLPESFPETDDRVWRFEQEARAAGALNHPGLVTIFDVGTTEGSPYIVMELLEGDTLREVLDTAPAPLPYRKAVDYATQIASALAVAHEKGIIHRDLKPENLFVTSEGRVKILDFGLAKLAAEATDVDGRRRTARHLTSAGIAVGTPGYMSPEQVRAQPIDHRTDIFSLGTVIFEMLSGRSIFERDSAVETMHAVLNVDPPPLSALVPNIPPGIEAVVEHCLEKKPQDRFQSARDLAFQLRMLPDQNTVSNVRQTAPGTTTAVTKRRRPYRAALAVLLAVLALAAAAGFIFLRAGGAATPPTPRAYQQLTFGDGLEVFPALAPDGKTFAYVSSQSGNRDIYVQRVDGRAAINITADSPDDDSEPVFSPDGSQVAFRSERDGGGIFVMGATGESVRRLTDFGHNPSWAPDGTRIVVSTARTELKPHIHPMNGDLWIVDARTGAKRLLFQAHTDGVDFDALQPSWSPHGHRIAFWGVSAARGARRYIWTIDPDAPQPKRTVVRATADPALCWNPVWSPDGKHLYFGSDRDGTLNLWRVALEEETGKPLAAAEPMSLPAAVSGNFAFSQKGDLVYTTVTRSYRVLAMPFDGTSAGLGTPRQLFGGSQEIMSFEPSPDRQIIAFTGGGRQEDLFTVNADGSRVRQLTNDAARDRGVTWSPDGQTLYFYSNRDGGYQIWSIRADGSGLSRVTNGSNFFTPSVSPDGRTLIAHTQESSVFVHVDRPIAQRLEAMSGTIDGAKWSPDGKYLAGGDRGGSLPDGGIVIYSLQTRQRERMLKRGDLLGWLPDGRRMAFIDGDSIGIFDLDSRRVTANPFTPLPGVELDNRLRLSQDGSTLYVRQTLEQGDVWMTRLEK